MATNANAAYEKQVSLAVAYVASKNRCNAPLCARSSSSALARASRGLINLADTAGDSLQLLLLCMSCTLFLLCGRFFDFGVTDVTSWRARVAKLGEGGREFFVPLRPLLGGLL